MTAAIVKSCAHHSRPRSARSEEAFAPGPVLFFWQGIALLRPVAVAVAAVVVVVAAAAAAIRVVEDEAEEELEIEPREQPKE